MKSIAAVLILTVVVYADDWKIQTHDDLIKYRAECVSSLSITEEQVAQYKALNFPDDAKTHSYSNCILTKMGLFDETNGFNLEHLVQQLGQNRDATETRNEVQKCLDKKDAADPATCAYKGLACFREAHLDLVHRCH